VLAVYVLLHLYYSKKKLKGVAFLMVLAAVGSQFITDSWTKRMQSIDQGTTTEKSAVGRIVVWRWAFDYVAERPVLGGGFYAYLANAGKLDQYSGEGEVVISQGGAKAYHNIYIEVLAETGYGGLIIFLSIILHILLLNNRVDPNDAWSVESTKAIKIFTILYCAGGMFINVAFYPWIYILYTLSVAKASIISKQVNEKKESRY
jgi:O-antigen ligase